jgi:hypothetical protein
MTTTLNPDPPMTTGLSPAGGSPKPPSSETTLSTQDSTQGEDRVNPLAEYIRWLGETPTPLPIGPRAARQSKQEFEMPTPSKEGLGSKVNYTIDQLKATASSLKVRRGGTKAVLRLRVHAALVRSHYASVIQSHYRGHLFRRYLNAKGLKGCKRPLDPSNDTELLTLEPVSFIQLDDLINIPNAGGKNTVYSVGTLHGVIAQHVRAQRAPADPYTNMPFGQVVLSRVREENRLAKVLRRRVPKAAEATLSDGSGSTTRQGDYDPVNLTHIVMDICSHLDALGHITNPQWFLSLSTEEWRRLNNHLSDIWVYRAQLPLEMRIAIGGRANLGFLRRGLQPTAVMRRVLDNIRRLVTRSQEREHTALGAIYVLIALTQVCASAAEAMPTLYEAGRNGA